MNESEIKQIGPTEKLFEAITFFISVEKHTIEFSPIDVFPLMIALL